MKKTLTIDTNFNQSPTDFLLQEQAAEEAPKSKRGRPTYADTLKSMKQELKSKRIQLLIEPSLHEEMQNIADFIGDIAVSELYRKAVKEFVARYKQED